MTLDATAGAPGASQPVPAALRPYALWSGIALVWLASGVVYLVSPPSMDQFNHAYLGWRWLQGEVPYRDVIDMNWPGVMGLHALGAALFGIRSWSWHALDFLLLAGSAAALFDLVRRGFGRPSALLAVTLYPLLYVSLPADFSGQHDMTGTQFLVGALWFHVRALEDRCWKKSLAAGAFLGAAMLNKPTLGLFGPLLPLHALLLRVPWRAALVHTAAAAGSSVAMILLGFGVVLASGASLNDVLDSAVRFNAATQFSDPTVPGLALSRGTEVHFRWWPTLVLTAGAATAWSLRAAHRSPASTALPLLWITGIASYVLQGRAYPYHLAPVFPAIVGLSAASIPLVARLAPAGLGPKAPPAIAAIAALLIFGTGIFKAAVQHRTLPAALVHGDRSSHESRFEGGEGLSFHEIRALAADVERSVPEHEPVLVLGAVSAVNLLSRRPQPTRFYYAWVLFHLEPSMPMAARWTELWRRDLHAAKPRWCLIPSYRLTAWMNGPSAPGRVLADFLREGYVRTTHVGAESGFGYDLYVRR